MALVVNVTPFDPACNSYVDVAFTDDYAATRVPDATVSAAWAALTADSKALYLVNASRFLDASFEWIGDRYSRDQKMDWPRVNAWVQGFLLDVISFPQRLKEATVEMALYSMTNDGAVSVEDQNTLGALQVGPIHLKFNNNDGQPAVRYIPDIVAYLLRDLGTFRDPNIPSARAIRTVTLVRA